jgi:undecaprenyl phosphate N,N'-diacetylbacillosamine 1-phosphate transferase
MKANISHNFYNIYGKRALDVVLSLGGLIVLAPVFLLITILARRKLGKPVIFTQERPGLNEKIFKMYKFRSMTDARDKDGNLLPDMDRITPFGKFLRSTSLDELPELLNVLKGEMSLVGPRPLLIEYLPLYNTEQKQRHLVRPGITGLAQINGRNAISWQEKFNYDIEYIQNSSLATDLCILLNTVGKVFMRHNVNVSTTNTMPKFEGNN